MFDIDVEKKRDLEDQVSESAQTLLELCRKDHSGDVENALDAFCKAFHKYDVMSFET